jgi:hypothetical protein
VFKHSVRPLRLAKETNFCHQKIMPSISDNRKSRGRPKVGATHVGVRLPPDQLARLDAWIARQPHPKPSRPEAIRRLLHEGLDADPAESRTYD